ncbi:MAG: NADH-quinone oxidoreductase subunit L, partial [Verrucomicrobia bacterium 21-51-4]
MAAAYGLGYPGLALFHLACHAFFKSLLFLGAGSVIHSCHHEQDIFKMGGLLRRMPVTSITFCCGTFALCAVTYFSGYYSKDAIIEAAYFGNRAAFWVLMLGAFMTSIYMGRLLWVAFFGEPNSEHAAHAKESPVVMVLPLVVLAFLAVFGGLTQYWPTVLEEPFLTELEHVHFMVS